MTVAVEAGDILLYQLGDSLRRHVGKADIVIRYGGEEFTLILPEAKRELTQERAERLRDDASQLHIQYQGQTLATVIISLGVSVFPDRGSTSAVVLKAADSALYRAKREGRDRVIVADQESCC